MTALGEFALWIALPVSFWGMAMGFVGGYQRRGDLVLSAERSIHITFALLLVASLGVVNAFLTDQFQYLYVASYSNRDLDVFFKISGLWAGQTGSLLFWAVLLAFFSAVCVYLNRRCTRRPDSFRIQIGLNVTFDNTDFNLTGQLGYSSRKNCSLA